jgi:hypothetical protein
MNFVPKIAISSMAAAMDQKTNTYLDTTKPLLKIIPCVRTPSSRCSTEEDSEEETEVTVTGSRFHLDNRFSDIIPVEGRMGEKALLECIGFRSMFLRSVLFSFCIIISFVSVICVVGRVSHSFHSFLLLSLFSLLFDSLSPKQLLTIDSGRRVWGRSIQNDEEGGI